ncbi:hypothetical protein D8674_031116 [Pyrus ussuriensis x Pyrus communis]|uniref:Uncharacterized protein n=1 Tax=Pyrus ussuriensis x Pyrus communis TaxID=2448454 RepID=A0A5N5EXY5_9ROSA|nr:hypothetical protein D8674_031116 [Pyrus ussuriensis x Pyrus communis]
MGVKEFLHWSKSEGRSSNCKGDESTSRLSPVKNSRRTLTNLIPPFQTNWDLIEILVSINKPFRSAINTTSAGSVNCVEHFKGLIVAERLGLCGLQKARIGWDVANMG